MREAFLGGRVGLRAGDCRAALVELAESSLDACVTDPPYHLTNNTGTRSPLPGQYTPIGRPKEPRGGFMGKLWDGGDVAFDPATWRAVYRVLKSGAHLVAFGGSRTYGRLQVAIEDAGFEVRDTIAWLYGSGFPKSHDVSKGIDRMLGGEREVGRQYIAPDGKPRGVDLGIQGGRYAGGQSDYIAEKLVTVPATDVARAWDGWGTALKPAMELICLARKPLSEGTVAANVLKWGTGAINVDGCRIGTDGGTKGCDAGPTNGIFGDGLNGTFGKPVVGLGRWPANLCHDGSAQVLAEFPDGGAQGQVNRQNSHESNSRGEFAGIEKDFPFYADSGSAARFFYTAKADSDDRLGSKHPTIKPLDLMQWLCRLVTPRGGVILDPFAGTGTTGEAAWREGMRAELIEAEGEYCADIRRRMALALAGPDERAREAIKAKNLPRDDGPLFAPRETWVDMWARPFDWSKESAK